MICLLVLAAGADWEAPALTALDAHPAVVVLRRCMDVEDLLATAMAGQADAALVSLEAPGLDSSSVAQLRRQGVSVVAVTQSVSDTPQVQDRASRLDIATVLDRSTVGSVADVVASLDSGDRVDQVDHVVEETDGLQTSLGGAVPLETKVVAVWGPGGAPGRTTVAVNLASELARRGTACLLLDADPYGGTIAQHLGVLDEVSGLLQVSRLATSGGLDEGWGAAVRRVGSHLGVITGLPRADRWREARPTHLEQVVTAAAARSHVVIDTGFGLEDEAGSELNGRSGRNAITLTALAMADEVVVVGAADPVGLARLARGLVELDQALEGAPTRVAVNRMRSSVGWSEREVAGMVEDFAHLSGLHFLPEDRAVVDRAMVSGVALVEQGDSLLARRIGEVTDAVFPESVEGARRVRRRRRRSAR